MYRYKLSIHADRELKKLPITIQKQIITKLDYFVSTDQPLSFAHHLVNLDIGHYRFRIGNYRVIFDIEADVILILSVGHRKEIY